MHSPPIWGSLTRGVPTGYAAAPLNQLIESGSEPVPVWPLRRGLGARAELVPTAVSGAEG